MGIYVLGLPLAFAFAFGLDLRLLGLWLALIAGMATSVGCELVFILRTDWDLQVVQCRERVKVAVERALARRQDQQGERQPLLGNQ
jgi:hypothetical protein